MKTRIRATAVLGFPAVVVCCSLPSATVAAASIVSPLPASNYTVHSACAAPAPGYAGCLALELVPRTAAARAHTHPLGMTMTHLIHAGSAAEGADGLRPQDLRNAYFPGEEPDAPASEPQTIAIVDAYNDLNAEADLKAYSKEFGLSEPAACTAGELSDCFEKVNQNGETGNLPFPASIEAREAEEAVCKSKAVTKKAREAREAACKEVEEADGWATEISLDIETAHAVCQNCKIMLVEAKSALFFDLEGGEKTAASLGATEISNSWGGPELGETQVEDEASSFNHPGIVITAAAGDNGYLDWGAKEGSVKGYADYPASSPHVVAVGGTRLSLSTGNSWASETVWNGDGAGGGGCSVELAAPEWQTTEPDWPVVGCGSGRAVADISADADPYTGVAIYDSTPEGPESSEEVGWTTVGGTSLASPLVASVFALAGGAHAVAYPAQTLYENLAATPSSLHDVTSGSNGKCEANEPFNKETGLSNCEGSFEAADCSGRLICKAGPGYDGPSGVGTPNGVEAFQPLTEEAKKKAEERKAKEKQTEEAKKQTEAKRAEETRTEEQKRREKTEAEERSGNSGVSGGGPGNSSSVTTTSSPDSSSSQPTVKLSAFALTPNALIALRHLRPRTSSVGFVFILSASARVRATLAKRVRVQGRGRWEFVRGALTFAAAKGRNHRHLTNRDALTPGRYRLTLTPQHGSARSIVFQIG